eukprot:gene30331-52447_t
MVVAPSPNAATTCAGGIVTAAAEATTVSLSGGSVGGNASCTVSVNITSAFVGTLNNTLTAGAITNTQGVTNANPFTANVASLAGLGVEKFFEPTAVGVGQPARLVIRIRNSLPQALTNISSTDNFPAGLVVSTPANATTTCAGTTLTAGFVIGGSTAKTVLVRAIGPGLAVFGVPGLMADPRLELFASGSVSIAINDNWGGDPQLTQAGARVGAFRIENAQSTDAMLLLTLTPGNYTAEVRGVSGGGAAL